jgi:hypothetical protein
MQSQKRKDIEALPMPAPRKDMFWAWLVLEAPAPDIYGVCFFALLTGSGTRSVRLRFALHRWRPPSPVKATQ